MRLLLPFAFAGALCLLASDSARAQEWTQFRGPNASGLGKAPNLPATFSEKDYNWKVELPGAGHSSPVIWGDRIFVTSNPKDTTKRVLTCLQASDGKTLWQKEFPSGEFRMHTDNNYAVATPALDEERVYFHWAAPDGSGLVALDQKDGSEVWKVDLGPFISQHGPGASPIVFEDLVILNFDPDQPKSFVAAFAAKTGKERWRWTHPGTKHTSSSATIFKPKEGAAQVITEGFDTGLVANDARTGALVWQLSGLMTKRCVATPFTTSEGLIVAQCGEGRAESFVEIVKPSADGKSAIKLHEIPRVGGYVPTPIAVGDLLYLWKENGFVTCVRTATAQQLWSERVKGSFYGSPVAVNDRLYNMTTTGDLIVLPAGEKFTPPTVIPLGEGSNASPAVSGGRMYLRTFTHLISVGK